MKINQILVEEDKAQKALDTIKAEKAKALEAAKKAKEAQELLKQIEAQKEKERLEKEAEEIAKIEADTEERMLKVQADEKEKNQKEEPKKEEPKSVISNKLADIEKSTKDAFEPLTASLKDGTNGMSKLLDKAITQQGNVDLCKDIVVSQLYKRAVQAQNVLYNELKDAILSYVDNKYSVKYSDYNDLDKYFKDIISKQPKSK